MIINWYKFLIPLFFLLSCGKTTTFKLDGVNVHLIQEIGIDSVPCRLYIKSDTFTRNNRMGVVFNFNVSYSGNSGGIAPGIAGTKDSIVSLKAFLKTKTQQINITNDLYNLEQSQLLNSDFQNSNDYRCTCFDTFKKRYYNYVHDKRYKKPTIYTYNRADNEDIIYWTHGDTSFYKNPYPIDTSVYETFFINAEDFVKAYNRLYLKKVAVSTYKSFKIINSGYDVKTSDFYFWISDKIVKQINRNDFISVEIELSDGRTLTNKFKLK
jgi:hypothetical protein